jgi:hypothetical protein
LLQFRKALSDTPVARASCDADTPIASRPRTRSAVVDVCRRRFLGSSGVGRLRRPVSVIAIALPPGGK